MCLGRWFSCLWAGEERASCGLVSRLETAVLVPDVLAQVQTPQCPVGLPVCLYPLSHDGLGDAVPCWLLIPGGSTGWDCSPRLPFPWEEEMISSSSSSFSVLC